MSQISKLCPLEDIQYVESSLNPSDVTTRASATVSELGPNSFHQLGPKFFCLPRSDWPVSSAYSSDDIPITEFKARDRLVFTAAARFNFCESGLYPNNPWTVIEKLLHYSDNIVKIRRIIARYLRGLYSDLRKSKGLHIDDEEFYNLISLEPTRCELQKAQQLLLLHAMPQTI